MQPSSPATQAPSLPEAEAILPPPVPLLVNFFLKPASVYVGVQVPPTTVVQLPPYQGLAASSRRIPLRQPTAQACCICHVLPFFSFSTYHHVCHSVLILYFVFTACPRILRRLLE